MKQRAMRNLLTISAILIGFWLVSGLGASTTIETSGTNNLSNGANVAVGGMEYNFGGAGEEAPWLRELMATDSCPESTLPGELGTIQQASSCVPYGHVCDPIYVPGAVCCPGTNCIKPYPGVPMYCL